MRRLAVEFAGALRQDAGPLVYDALKLSALCNSSAHPAGTNSKGQQELSLWSQSHDADETTWHVPVGPTIHVDNGKGSDASGDGSIQEPFRSIERALAASRSLPDRTDTNVTIQLAGTPQPYELKDTLRLTAADSGLTIMSAPGATMATITGGRILRPKWTPVALTGRNESLRVYKATDVRGNFTTMSIAGKRQILARFPEADPESALCKSCK